METGTQDKAVNYLQDLETAVEVDRLQVCYRRGHLTAQAVDRISFRLFKGKTLGLAGESGCGKSTAALALLGLTAPGGEISGGRILFGGRDLLSLSENELRLIRGRRIAMIFQEPGSHLNPVLTIGTQLAEVQRTHLKIDKESVRQRSLELLNEVGVPDPAECLTAFPHQLSGGLQQRVLIAQALSCDPEVLIADEPTTALDVTVQAQILRLLDRVQQKYGLAMLIVSHDWGVIGGLAHQVAVMYAGEIVEEGPAAEIMRRPSHPYTQLLLQAIPGRARQGVDLPVIPGRVPDLIEPPSGCRFHPRCPEKVDDCSASHPPRVEILPHRHVLCLLRSPEGVKE